MVVTARNSSHPAYMQAESIISAGTLRSPRPMKARWCDQSSAFCNRSVVFSPQQQSYYHSSHNPLVPIELEDHY